MTEVEKFVADYYGLSNDPDVEKNLNVSYADVVNVVEMYKEQFHREDVLDSLSELMRSLTRIANKTPDAVLNIDLVRLEMAKKVLKANYPPLDKSQIPVQSKEHDSMRSCHVVNVCTAEYTHVDKVFARLEMACDYADKMNDEVKKIAKDIEYRVRTMPLFLA